MASTSTGFNKSLINRLMPSSSGQMEEFSSGCKLNMKVNSEIEMESGSTLNMESGAVQNVAGTLNIASGGKFNPKSGSPILFDTGSHLRMSVVVHTSLTKTLAASGVSIITASTTGKVEKVIFTLGKPLTGEMKWIVQGCTFVQIVRGSSVAKRICFGTTRVYSYTLPKSSQGKGKNALQLIASSSGKWFVLGRSTAGVNQITPSTVCT